MSGTVLLLLVEDEPLIALATQEALEAGGFTLLVANDADEAMRFLESQSGEIAGLVTDIRLGVGLSGWEVAKRARELRSGMPVVYTSGDSAHEWTANGVPNSVMIQKPYAFAQLLTAVAALLTRDEGCWQSH